MAEESERYFQSNNRERGGGKHVGISNAIFLFIFISRHFPQPNPSQLYEVFIDFFYLFIWTRLYFSVFRVFPLGARLLFGVDLLGRAILHRVHNAFMHNQRRPLPQPAISHEFRTQ